MSDEYRCMRFLWALSVGLWTACTEPNPASCLDNFCSDPALPFCDVDGSIGGVPNTCIAVSCTANEFKECQQDRALVCNPTGDGFEQVDCEFGCGETGCLPCNTSDCEQHIVPKYLPTACDDLPETSLSVTDDLAIDTSVDANCTSVVTQVTGPGICVIHHESIAIAENKTLTVTGSRVLALVADRSLDLRGILDASANHDVNGPGGGFKTSGSGASVAGGGAGYRTRGGHGGSETTDGGAANGGSPEANPASLTELFGGTQPTRTAPNGKPGGAGGGLSLICCRCTLSVIGVIDVNGGGGSGAPITFMPTSIAGPAGGGGAGGTVVLQGLGIELTGQVFANGGGGGSGTASTVGGPNPGDDGPRSTACAAGGVPAGAGGVGGAGGCGAAVAQDGKKFANTGSTGPGGGGGSAGFLLTYTPQAVGPMLNPLAVSPSFEPNGTIGTN